MRLLLGVALAVLMSASIFELTEASTRQADTWGHKFSRLTAPQREVMSDDSERLVWRDGNQMGKSWALALELIHRCRGSHPYKRTHRAPIRALVISVSLEQMAPLMEKIWMLAPKDELHEKCGYDPGRGITGKPP